MTDTISNNEGVQAPPPPPQSPQQSQQQSQQQLRLSDIAFAKILRHSIEYTTGSIHGILIGEYKNDGSLLQVQDCIPICHSAPTKPLLDMAFHLVQSHVDDCNVDNAAKHGGGGLQVVGWYTANKRVNDMLPNQAALRIIGTIAAHQTQKSLSSSSSSSLLEPVLLMVNPNVIASMIANQTDNKNPLIAYGKDQKKQWLRLIPKELFTTSKKQLQTMTKVCQLEETEAEEEEEKKKDGVSPTLYDFESHLKSVGSKEIEERDWLENSNMKAILNM